ncbi:type II toxin-antitoxin system VapC family toxin [Mucilaginibacter ginkgonis]|uniref:PIN domain-containing protein n=1 Tax=Mucilaginibacter ginkgonis TaxID=2682091 RepID=A0A7T7JG21_9SPHI|nr:PIN domain-containing protein [Mucilaginibacter ginkgonis]QQL49118.1 PIN domain-containing protein [Mucilaginibacter ginkgonis]
MMRLLNSKLILVDTSVWISFFRGIETPYSNYLRQTLLTSPIATCPTIVQDVLQGVANDAERLIVDSYLTGLVRMADDPYEMAEDAAEIFRILRKKGITIRKPNDCLIAAFAIKNDAYLLQDDKDFRFIAENSGVKLIEL